MAKTFTFKLDGLAEVRSSLRKLKRKSSRVETAVRQVADLFVKDMKATIIHNQNIETGHLLNDSLMAQQIEKTVWQVSAITTRKEYDYALAIEYGTWRHPAFPFFAPAWWMAEKELIKRIEKVMK